MPQFLVIARDGEDEGALARRMAARPAHQANVVQYQERGMVVAAGPMLDTAGRPVGTIIVADVASRAELDAWIAGDPYSIQGVWQRVEVTPMAVVYPPR